MREKKVIVVKDSNDKVQRIIESYLSYHLKKHIRNKRKRHILLEKSVIAVMAAKGLVDITYLRATDEYEISLKEDDSYRPELG